MAKKFTSAKRLIRIAALFLIGVNVNCRTGSAFEKLQIEKKQDNIVTWPEKKIPAKHILIMGFKPNKLLSKLDFNYWGFFIPVFPGTDTLMQAHESPNIDNELPRFPELRNYISKELCSRSKEFFYSCLEEPLPNDPTAFLDNYDAVVFLDLVSHTTGGRLKTYYLGPLTGFVWIWPFATPDWQYYSTTIRLNIYVKDGNQIKKSQVTVMSQREKSIYYFGWALMPMRIDDNEHILRITSKIISALQAI